MAGYLTHTSAGDSQTFTGKPGSVSCGVTAPFSWVLVWTSFCCALQESVSLGGSESFCVIPRLGNLLWALELLQQCENFFDMIVLQFVGCLLGGSIVVLKAISSKKTKHTLRLPGLQQPDPLSPWQVTDDPCLHRRHSNTEGQVCLSLLWEVHSIFPSVLAHTSFVCTLRGLWRVWDAKHNCTPPTILLGLLLCSWMWGIFLVGSNLLLLMVVQQLAVTFVFLQKTSVSPSTLPSW